MRRHPRLVLPRENESEHLNPGVARVYLLCFRSWPGERVPIQTPQPTSRLMTGGVRPLDRQQYMALSLTALENPYAGRLNDNLSTPKQHAGQKRHFSGQQHPRGVNLMDRAHAGPSRTNRPTKKPRLDSA